MKYVKLLGTFITVGSLMYLWRVIVTLIDYGKVAGLLNVAAIVSIVVCMLLSTLLVFFAAWAWQTVMRYVAGDSVSVPYRDASRLYVQANISKYLPGNIFHYVERNLIGSRYGWKQNHLLLTSVIETICVLTAVLSMSIFSVIIGVATPFTSIYLALNKYIIVGGVVTTAVALGIYMLKYAGRYGLEGIIRQGFWKVIGKVSAMYIVLLFAIGMMLPLIYFALYRQSIQALIPVLVIFVTGFVFSWFAGFITPASPGGIGVRESLLLITLGPHFGQEQVLFAALALRFVTISGDVVAFTAEWLSRRIKEKNW